MQTLSVRSFGVGQILLSLCPVTAFFQMAESFVWKYFKKDQQDKKSVICGQCNKTLRFCSTTSNLASHLKTQHGITNASVEKGISFPKILSSTDQIGQKTLQGTAQMAIRSHADLSGKEYVAVIWARNAWAYSSIDDPLFRQQFEPRMNSTNPSHSTYLPHSPQANFLFM